MLNTFLWYLKYLSVVCYWFEFNFDLTQKLKLFFYTLEILTSSYLSSKKNVMILLLWVIIIIPFIVDKFWNQSLWWRWRYCIVYSVVWDCVVLYFKPFVVMELCRNEFEPNTNGIYTKIYCDIFTFYLIYCTYRRYDTTPSPT